MCAVLSGGFIPAGSAQDWKAQWITHPAVALREPAVVHFRRALHLDAKPAHYVIHVSADNRFVLYVNGKRVGDGPARGDLAHWRFETFDLADFLKAGDNLVAATVWNYGIYAPVAQITDRLAFVLQGEGALASELSTPKEWQVEVERGLNPIPRKPGGLNDFMASGPGEHLDASKYDWNWNSLISDPISEWVAAASPMREQNSDSASNAVLAGVTENNYWQLVADTLPHMEFAPTEAGHVVRSDGGIGKAFPDQPVNVPAHSHIHVLLDRGTLTTGYPKLTVSGGKGSTIRLTYTEALYDKKQQKGDRNEVGDRQALGFHDEFVPDGGDHRSFEPLWWRCWRYLDLDIQTGEDPVKLESLTANFSAYPFTERASFHSDNEELKKIWDISWRTARLDAHETYMDTPYWEQLQYIGDTRIQALISYTVAGDDRLARQALIAFDNSRIPAGITQSRYPTSQPQFIPTFSLLWIGMLHDYWMYRPDTTLVKETLPGTRTVLEWFSKYEQPDGLLRQLPWWSFVDWVSSGAIPTYDSNGESCVTSLEYLGALGEASDMEGALGEDYFADLYDDRAKHVRQAIYEKCWDDQRKMLADTSAHTGFSQQANALAVLYDVVPKSEQPAVMRKILPIEPGTTPDGVLSSSYYVRFYLARALDHSGLGNEYLNSLQPWRELLPLHFSTWPETPGETRSDSHAWSSHPAYDLLTLVAGIEPATPGFASVRIAPHPGELKAFSATFPHPKGEIAVDYRREGDRLAGTITLPSGLDGTYLWNGKTQMLHAGRNEIGAQ
jgi:hypothetical protein